MAKTLKRWLWRLFLLFASLVVVYQSLILLQITYWNHYNPSTSAFMQARLESVARKGS